MLLAQDSKQDSLQGDQKNREQIELNYTYWMSRGARDMQWSKTYFESYITTNEKRYLLLAAEHCKKAIEIYFKTQSFLSRTTKFFSQADQKRLYACQFYDRIQKKSFLLTPRYHVGNIGSSCQLF